MKLPQIFKKRWGIVVIVLFLFALPLVGFAAEKAATIYIGPNEIIDGNVIKAGNVIDIAGSVKGDVIVFGNDITISGPVAGDVIAAGNNIRISGVVSGSVRMAGNNIDISSAVNKNVWVVAGNVNFGDKSSVGWDLTAAAGSINIKGVVGGNVVVSTGNLIIANKVNKDVVVNIDRQGNIVLYPSAEVGGNLEYQALSENQLTIQDGAKITGTVTKKELMNKPETDARHFLYAAGVFAKTIGLFGLIVVGLVLIGLVPKFLVKVNDEMVQSPGAAIGSGVIYFFLMPIAIVILAVTIIGLPLALILVPIYLISIYLAKLIVGFVVGWWIFMKASKSKYKKSLIWPLIIGLVVITIVGSIPIVGWLAMLVAIWWALGGILRFKKGLIKEFK